MYQKFIIRCTRSFKACSDAGTKKRGRKPKPKDQVELKPKRPRGRPIKDANQSAGDV